MQGAEVTARSNDIDLGTVQTGTGKVDLARKFKCTTAARESSMKTLF